MKLKTLFRSLVNNFCESQNNNGEWEQGSVALWGMKVYPWLMARFCHLYSIVIFEKQINFCVKKLGIKQVIHAVLRIHVFPM